MKSSADAVAALVRADILVLLREKRYEEALARLYQARSESPDSAELQKGIDQVKEFLIGAYAKRLGGLDQIARPVPPASGRSPDVVLLSRYIDGTSTYGDLAQMCPLGRLRTLQVLMEMYPRQASHPAAEPEVPYSGPRSLDTATPRPGSDDLQDSEDERPPETARSSSAIRIELRTEPVEAAPETPEERHYRELFQRGTAAFVQRRYADALELFEACRGLRPDDDRVGVMLRNVSRGLESR
jgi:hypothetical protein